MHSNNNSAIGKVILTGIQLAEAKLLVVTDDINSLNLNEL
mgnify:CR=1 FL=1